MKKVNTYCQFQLIRNKEVKECWNEEKYMTANHQDLCTAFIRGSYNIAKVV